MSWGAYITNSLVNKQDANGHVYNDALTEAAIMGHNGAEWAKTAGLTITPDEIKNINTLFGQKNNSIPSIVMGGKKYQVTHYEEGAFAYLKIKDGGATIAKTNQAYIIGVYNTTKKYKYDGKEMPQSVGVCNTMVEDLAATLKGMNY
jgi:profilin